MTKRALTSSGVSVGICTKDVINRVMQRAHERIEESELRLRIERDKWKYDKREEIWVIVKQHPGLRIGDPDRFSAETVGQVDGIGAHVQTDHPERTPKAALTELRFKLSKLWHAKKLCETAEEARERAAKVTFRQAIIGANDSALAGDSDG